MATEYKLSYTANEINTKLGKIDSLAEKSEIPTKTSDLTNNSGFITSYTETDPTVPAWAKAANKPSYTASEVGADAVGTAVNAISAHNASTNAHADIREEISDLSATKADKSQGVFYIEGDSSSTTDTTNKVATWIGSHDEITEYFSGLTILYKVVTAGSTTTTLNINNLGAVAVVRNATTGISTSCPVNSVLLLTYTVDSDGTAYWKTADYDANTKNTAGTSNKTGTKLFLVGGASQSSSGVTTYSNSNVYINTSNQLYSAQGFSGNLTGNADTATKASQDASGNVIADTYETKEDADAKFSQLSSEKVVLYGEQTLTEEQKAQARKNIGATGNKWAGKIASFLGDSITRGINTEKTYHAYLQELVGFFACNSYGISGSTIASYYEAMCNRVSAIDDQSDIVFVFGGTNDFNVGIPMGEWYTLNGTTRTVNKDISTFRGALATLCEALLSRFPNKNNVLLTPLHRHTYPDDYTEMQANDKGLYLEDYVNAIKEAGKIYSIPVIDLYAESGLYPRSNASAAIYFHSDDKLHPNAAGHRVIADVIRGFLDRTYPMYVEPDQPTDEPEPVYYPVELNTENCTISNSATTAASGSAYSATVDVISGYDLESLTVTMDGTDITSSAVNGKYIYIATVTGNIVITAVAVQAYTNLVPTSIDTDGSIYNGTGYKDATRINSSGQAKTHDTTAVSATGFIKVSGGDVVRVAGCEFRMGEDLGGGNANAIAVYGSSKNHLGTTVGGGATYGIFKSTYSQYAFTSVVEESNGVYKWVVPPTASGVEWIRLSCAGYLGSWDHPGANLIVTINEEIT